MFQQVMFIGGQSSTRQWWNQLCAPLRPQLTQLTQLIWLSVVAVAFATILLPDRAEAIWVYMSEQEAIDIAFPNGEHVVRIDLEGIIHPELRLATERKLGRALVLPYMKCFQGSLEGTVTGYACIDNVIGRYRPITFMVKLNHPSGELAWYEILVYRELVGRNSRRGPFREQFLNMTIKDSMVYGEDLKMIVGATLTCDHLVVAFRKHFYLYENILRGLPVQPELPAEHFKEMKQLRATR